MKNLMILGIVFFASAVFAGPKNGKAKAFTRNYGVAGCGIGSVIVGKRGGQIFAATSNNSTSNQMFGISAGTLNCVDGPTEEIAQNMDKFIIANKPILTAEVAKGNGETIAALASIMGCEGSSKKVGQVLKSNFNKIFSGSSGYTNIMTDEIITTIMNDSVVSKECNLEG